MRKKKGKTKYSYIWAANGPKKRESNDNNNKTKEREKKKVRSDFGIHYKFRLHSFVGVKQTGPAKWIAHTRTEPSGQEKKKKKRAKKMS